MSENLRRLFALCLASTALYAVAVPAAAEGTGFYVGASAGLTAVDVCGDLVGLGLTSCDDEDTGFKVFAGKGINQSFAVELAWVDLGEVTATGPGGTVRVGTDGIQVAGVGIFPVTPQFRAFGKVGFYLWNVSARGPGGSFSDDGTDIMFGLGAAWNLARQLDLRAEWERFDIDGDNVDLLSVGLQYSF